ncbi:unnamed protein product [Effrenium voratum]|uniref:Uncharacterized protein n=1 Tax=Effrenium voratum TaxID=2562239 RepID=A0AA36NDD5_9DINO|nr:unnamed protein product [Effrenium voratum]
MWQMRDIPFQRFDQLYEGPEFADARFAELVPWGRDQTFTGLAHGTPSLGVLEHHEGFMQACAVWRDAWRISLKFQLDGVADGPGMWSSIVEGKEQCGYGAWVQAWADIELHAQLSSSHHLCNSLPSVQGKRHGYFALVKEGAPWLWRSS